MKARHVALLVLAGLAVGASAKWARPEDIPTSRVVANLDAALKANPRDVDARLTLARAHALAYSSGFETTPMYGANFPTWQWVSPREDGSPNRAANLHLRKSLVNFDLVIHAQPDNGLAWLGAGVMLEEAGRWAAQNKPIRFAGSTLTTKKEFDAAALAAYRKCFAAGLVSDFSRERVMHGIQSDWLTKESGQSIIRMVEAGVGGFESGERTKIEDAIKRSDERPAAITPILFPVDRARPLADLIESGAKVKFDLAGDQAGRSWPWITANAAWLVWDPETTGKVTSGRQLFGSATWWMMFNDGYAALATLDDNQDGWLKGAELKGIAAWQDRNGNAVSDAGEVRPLADWGVAAIRVRYDQTEPGALVSTQGIVMKDGQIRPTYDWIPVGSPVR